MIIGRKEEIKLLKDIRKRINDLTKLTKPKHAFIQH